MLTVSWLAQSKEDSPSAVTVLDHATIRVFGIVPGFYVGKNAGFIYNSNHVVSYHGMASAYADSMQVLINGRSVYSPLFGGVKAYHSFNSSDDSVTSANLRPIFPAAPALLSSTEQANNDIELERCDIEAQHIFVPAIDWRLLWGENIRLDTTYSLYWLGTREMLTQNGLSQKKWAIEDK